MTPERSVSFVSQIFLLSASGFILAALGLAYWLDMGRTKPVALIPSLTGQVEYCLTCHADLPDISPSHPRETFGCVICHGGERLALEADLAHSSMRGGKNPSDLSVVEQSCGGENCHSGAPAELNDHIQRVMTSIQSTYTGAITNIRYTFGAQPDQTPRYGTVAVQDTTQPSNTGINALEAFQPADQPNPLLQSFGQNCLICHLNAEPRDGGKYDRFTGCAACHSPALSPTDGENQIQGQVHRLTTAIPYTQCNTCHNRGNYDLRTMTFVERTDQPTTRIQDYYQPIAQFVRCEYTLDCVDCHTRTEAMGDGDIHATQSDIQYIQCKSCHGTLTELPLTQTLNDPLDIAFKMAFLNPVFDLKPGDTILVTERGEPLWNTRVLSDGAYELIGKVTRQRFLFNPVMGTDCEQNPAEQESHYCHKCHAVER
ncbi:MAG: hypothetical protein JXB15_16165 [Anaerolineales bacterium]|nr:hypothetical protein [Anaerolineales bacterium]